MPKPCCCLSTKPGLPSPPLVKAEPPYMVTFPPPEPSAMSPPATPCRCLPGVHRPLCPHGRLPGLPAPPLTSSPAFVLPPILFSKTHALGTLPSPPSPLSSLTPRACSLSSPSVERASSRLPAPVAALCAAPCRASRHWRPVGARSRLFSAGLRGTRSQAHATHLRFPPRPREGSSGRVGGRVRAGRCVHVSANMFLSIFTGER